LKKECHLVKWSKICKAKRKGGGGGLGVKNMRKMNVRLLCKWWWVLKNEEVIWQQLVRLKYIKNSPICLVKHKPQTPQCGVIF
jgi:hypothetical protein